MKLRVVLETSANDRGSQGECQSARLRHWGRKGWLIVILAYAKLHNNVISTTDPRVVWGGGCHLPYRPVVSGLVGWVRGFLASIPAILTSKAFPGLLMSQSVSAVLTSSCSCLTHLSVAFVTHLSTSCLIHLSTSLLLIVPLSLFLLYSSPLNIFLTHLTVQSFFFSASLTSQLLPFLLTFLTLPLCFHFPYSLYSLLIFILIYHPLPYSPHLSC